MSAIFSPCGRYRYRLDRDVQLFGLVFGYCGINGSTAGADVEDHTTRKWHEFTRRNVGRKYIAFNPFAMVATDVSELAGAIDPVGPDNALHVAAAIAECDVLVPCWGNRTKVPPRLRHHIEAVTNQIFASGKPVMTFGWTKAGDPKHPLTLGYDTRLQVWHG